MSIVHIFLNSSKGDYIMTEFDRFFDHVITMVPEVPALGVAFIDKFTEKYVYEGIEPDVMEKFKRVYKKHFVPISKQIIKFRQSQGLEEVVFKNNLWWFFPENFESK